MALPASGAISLGQVQAEFGGTNPIPLSEYYEGAGRVAAGDTQPNDIPASGAISLHDFHGAAKAGGYSVSLNRTSVYGSCVNADVSCTATTNLITRTVNGGVGPFTTAWELVSGITHSVNGQGTETASFSKSCAPGTISPAVYRCKVTDTGNGNAIAYSSNFNVETENLG